MKNSIIILILCLLLMCVCSAAAQNLSDLSMEPAKFMPDAAGVFADPADCLGTRGSQYAADYVYEGHSYSVYKYEAPESVQDFIKSYVIAVYKKGCKPVLGSVDNYPAVKVYTGSEDTPPALLLYNYRDSMLYLVPSEISHGENSADGLAPSSVSSESGSAGIRLPEPEITFGIIDNLNSTGANLRKKPMIRSRLLGILKNGQKVTLTGARSSANGYDWVEVRLDNDVLGWVIEDAVSIMGSETGWVKGAEFSLGKYEQDNDPDNGKEPIVWQVLYASENRALVLSKYGLDVKPFHDLSENSVWKTSSLRRWLNTDFFKTAFSAGEKALIKKAMVTNPDNPVYGTDGGDDTKDRLFILSIAEAKRFFKTDMSRQCPVTQYAIANGAEVDPSGMAWWWLRTPGSGMKSSSSVISNVDASGLVREFGNFALSEGGVIRPAFWLDLSDAADVDRDTLSVKTIVDGKTGEFTSLEKAALAASAAAVLSVNDSGEEEDEDELFEPVMASAGTDGKNQVTSNASDHNAGGESGDTDDLTDEDIVSDDQTDDAEDPDNEWYDDDQDPDADDQADDAEDPDNDWYDDDQDPDADDQADDAENPDNDWYDDDSDPDADDDPVGDELDEDDTEDADWEDDDWEDDDWEDDDWEDDDWEDDDWEDDDWEDDDWEDDDWEDDDWEDDDWEDDDWEDDDWEDDDWEDDDWEDDDWEDDDSDGDDWNDGDPDGDDWNDDDWDDDVPDVGDYDDWDDDGLDD